MKIVIIINFVTKWLSPKRLVFPILWAASLFGIWSTTLSDTDKEWLVKLRFVISFEEFRHSQLFWNIHFLNITLSLKTKMDAENRDSNISKMLSLITPERLSSKHYLYAYKILFQDPKRFLYSDRYKSGLLHCTIITFCLLLIPEIWHVANDF